MVQDSGKAESTRENEAEDFLGGNAGFGVGALFRGEFAGAGVAGEFEPGAADLDGRGARD